MIDTLLQAARTDLLDASTNLDIARKCGFPQETPIKQLYQALDRAWEMECMVSNAYAPADAPHISKKLQSVLRDREMPNPFAEVSR